jgi:hypothetical protein
MTVLYEFFIFPSNLAAFICYEYGDDGYLERLITAIAHMNTAGLGHLGM